MTGLLESDPVFVLRPDFGSSGPSMALKPGRSIQRSERQAAAGGQKHYSACRSDVTGIASTHTVIT